MEFSNFANKLAKDSAIVGVMEDLGEALNVNPELLFLGGGNPARIADFEQELADHLQQIVAQPDALHKLVGVYQSPRGSESFIQTFVEYVNHTMDWQIKPSQVAITNGSQSAFFMLINLLTGQHEGNQHKTMVFPMMPEYLGYSDQSSSHNVFRAYLPKITLTAEHRFKYNVDFSALKILKEDAAICVSRPTNPSGNVIPSNEIKQLSALARANNIPLIIDCAYGDPFPGIVFSDDKLSFDDNTIYVMSCSKLGMPGARTGIVVGPERLMEQLVNMNTVISLASCSFGPSVMTSLINKGVLNTLCQQVLLPFYRSRRDFTLACVDRLFANIAYRVHEPEGAFFLWVWLPELPISAADLYQRLKNKGVLIMNGEHFFFGLKSPGTTGKSV